MTSKHKLKTFYHAIMASKLYGGSMQPCLNGRRRLPACRRCRFERDDPLQSVNHINS